MSLLRRYSEYVNGPLITLQSHPPPRFLKDRHIRSPLLPIVHLVKCMLVLRTVERGGMGTEEDPQLGTRDLAVQMQDMVEAL